MRLRGLLDGRCASAAPDTESAVGPRVPVLQGRFCRVLHPGGRKRSAEVLRIFEHNSLLAVVSQQ